MFSRYTYLWVVLCLALTTHAHAQQTIDLAPFQVAEGWYRINGGLDISPTNFLLDYKHYWGLTPQDEVRLHKTETDDLGYTHYRYRQFKNGYVVEHTDFFLHYKDSLLVEANANVVPNLNVATNASISEATALGNALAYLNAREYAWQNADMTAQLREDTEDSTATYYPVGELVLARLANEELNARGFKFAYRFDVLSIKPYKHDYVYVDANTGEVLQKTSLIRTLHEDKGDEHDYTPPPFEAKKPRLNKCDVNATCTTLYYGHQNITVIKRAFDYKLKECDRNIHTVWTTTSNWTFNITDDDGEWGTDDQDGTSAHWTVERCHDYFRGVFNRRGCNGKGNPTTVWARSYNTGWFFSTNGGSPPEDVLMFTSDDGYLDAAGHLYTLGVSNATCQLDSKGESGSLERSFADIFATMIERDAQGGNFNWTIGEAKGTGFITTSLQNPLAYSQPEKYKGQFWIDMDYSWNNPNFTTGIHKNKAVQNHWFYLLSVGGTKNNVTVQGIGIDNAARITYLSFTQYIHALSKYDRARECSIAAAIQLYGECSMEVAQVRNAWAAVGVGEPNNAPICIRIAGSPARLCRGGGVTGLSYTAFINSTIPVVWEVSSGISYNTSGARNEHIHLYNIPYVVSNIQIKATVDSISSTYNITFRDCGRVKVENASVFSNLEELGKEIMVYPNPTQDTFTLDLGIETVENASATIFSTQGKEVSKFKLARKSTDIRVSHLPAGLYFLHITVGNERKVLKLVVK